MDHVRNNCKIARCSQDSWPGDFASSEFLCSICIPWCDVILIVTFPFGIEIILTQVFMFKNVE